MTSTVHTMSGNIASVDLPTSLTGGSIHVRTNWARRPSPADAEELKAFLTKWGNKKELQASAIEWLDAQSRVR